MNNEAGQLLSKAHQLFKAGDMDRAVPLYRQTLEIDANNLMALNNLGTIYLTKGNYDESACWLNRALTIDPNSFIANSNLGFILLQSGKYLEAAEHFMTALKKEPEQAFLWNDLGDALRNSGQFAAAADCYKKAVKINPDYIDSYMGLGEIAAKKEKPSATQDAIGYFNKALSLDENNAKAHYELSRIYYLQTCEFEQAVYHAQKALSIKPGFDEANITLAELLLKQGNFSEGFPLFDQSRHLYIDKQTSRYQFFQMIPRWHGESFSGKRIIIGEDGGFGGFGDHIMFARYIPLVKQRGGCVTLPVKKELFRLFKSLDGIEPDELLLPTGDAIQPEDFDLQIPFISLPTVFKTSLDTIPKAPYLSVGPELNTIWKSRVNNTCDASSNNLKVGLVWACNPNKQGNPQHRACDIQTLKPLFDLPNVTYYNLQIGEAVNELSECGIQNIIDLTGHIEDFADTAALISNLDLVISVDTAVAHLTGAIGRPVWLILSFVSVWYWLIDRIDSPWYPSMRVFHSKTPGDWSGVVEEVRKQLQSMHNS